MKATTSGITVGIALESFDGSTSTTSQLLPNGTSVQTGKILVFVNLGYSKLDDSVGQLSNVNGQMLGTNAWSVDQQSSKVNVNFFGDVNLQGNSILDVAKITGYLGKWSLDENGKLVVQDLEVKGKAKFGTPENPQGITIYDKTTKQPVCVFSDNNTLKSEPGECGTSSPPLSPEAELESESESESTIKIPPAAAGETSTTTATSTSP